MSSKRPSPDRGPGPVSKQEPSIPWSTRNNSRSNSPSSPTSSTAQKTKKPLASPSPSASVLLVSPTNQVLLLHRVQTSSSFPSAHVFPGGNLERSDGDLPQGDTNPFRHVDNTAYRTAAIRELFEESGILLARQSSASDAPLLRVPLSTRLEGRTAIHDNSTAIRSWLASQSSTAVLDTANLIPFTRWITPTNVPKRFTTQMYIYFLPTSNSTSSSPSQSSDDLTATSDEVETMAPEWQPASTWLQRARAGEIILFPPQFLLLSFVSEFLDLDNTSSSSQEPTETEIQSRRDKLINFINNDSTPVWREKIICPTALSFTRSDGKTVLGLDKPGPELREHAKSKSPQNPVMGEFERVVLVRFSKAGPREVEVRWRKEVLEEERMEKEKEKEKGGSKL